LAATFLFFAFFFLPPVVGAAPSLFLFFVESLLLAFFLPPFVGAAPSLSLFLSFVVSLLLAFFLAVFFFFFALPPAPLPAFLFLVDSWMLSTSPPDSLSFAAVH